MIILDWTFIVLLCATIIVFFIVWIIWPTIIGAIYVPTPHEFVGKMLEIAEVKEDDILYDLGSGDGRIIIEAADKYKAKAIGIEADPLRVLWSRAKIRSREMQNRVHVIWGNFFRSDLSEATVVTVYQGQGINNKLIDKLEEELKPGTRVVSYSFTFDGWTPSKEEADSPIYLYITRAQNARAAHANVGGSAYTPLMKQACSAVITKTEVRAASAHVARGDR